jgi:cytoskeletal protein CcmA (bactofilin family)
MKHKSTTYQATRLTRARFRHFGDVIIDGPVDIKDHLIVIGDLTVRGDLHAHGVFCFGSVRVSGNVKAGLFVAVGGINIEGDACAITMESGAEVGYTAAIAELPDDASRHPETYFARWRGDDFFDDLEELRQSGFAEVTIGGFLDVCTCDFAYGLRVGEWFDVDTGLIGGPTIARQLYFEEDLRVHGSLTVAEAIEGGELFVGDLDVSGHVEVAELFSEEDVVVRGHLRAGDVKVGGALSVETYLSSYGKVIVKTSLSAGEAILAKEGVQVGEEYGILCGTRVRRSEWPQRGWISCPGQPKHLYTGVYLKKKDFDEMDELLTSLESENAA